MDISEFKRVLTTFADEPSDVDVRLGKVVAQIRDDIIDVSIKYSDTPDRQLLIIENDQPYPVRTWLLTRVARLPQLADRIIASTNVTPEVASKSPFVVPSGVLSPDLSSTNQLDDVSIEDTVTALLDKATTPLPGATSVLYITSDAGEGKTTIINQAARLQAVRYKEKKAASLVVPIPLGGRAFLTFDDAVIAALVNKLRFNYLYFDAFMQLVRMGAIVPAFDGYEEMLVEGSKNEAVSALGNLVQTLDSSGTVFIAARKAFFEYLSFKTQAKLLDAIGDRSASFSRLAISRWDKSQFCEYGRQRKIDNPEGIYEMVATRLGSEHPLLTRAVLVRRLFDVAAEQGDCAELAQLLGSNPHDYFYTFVDAIVKREASEKWLSRVTGEVMEPLLEIAEHHELLSLIALEMWQSSASSLRYDVIDVLVDIFADGRKKSSSAVRQIKERLKQHSLLISDPSRGQALAFDHEDFQSFYVGEGLGRLLSQCIRSDLQTFLSVNLLSTATVEQSVQYLIRHESDLNKAVTTLIEINASETGVSFCKENCGILIIRIVECTPDRETPLILDSMFFAPEALSSRNLQQLVFQHCHFQPTNTSNGHFVGVEFRNCEFERIEINSEERGLENCVFTDCRINSLVLTIEDEYLFDPILIISWLERVGAQIGDASKQIDAGHFDTSDERLKILERFLRVFLRSSQVDEEVIRLRLGNVYAQRFFDGILPILLSEGILENVPWRGRGVQHRYKLAIQMSKLSDALEEAHDSFDTFISVVRR